MGREMKRVALDFDWPWQGDGRGVWPGYLFGHEESCEETYDSEAGGYQCGKPWHEHIEPPAGEGYQLWETTSEGAPISPVFETLDALCEWAESNATTFGTTYYTSAAEWKRMLEGGLVETRIAPNVIAI